jgi:uncharacterized protein with PQ loop repeat
MGFNIVMYVSPLQKLYEVIQTGDTKLIPMATSLIGVLNCTCWFIYGVMINDLNVQVPNGLGIFFSLCNLTVYGYYNKWPKEKKTEYISMQN